ncbi:flagellar cap protein FliD N-terminal domain-containing protein, partial [Candidatus Omnitrophota bacterium]
MAGLGSINFGGLYSGLDTQKIIEDLLNVDSLPVKRLENQKEDLTTKRDTFTSMNSNLLELKNSVAELKSSTSFGAFSASSSDEEALTLSASSSANAGTYNVKVLSLAQAETLSSSSYSQTDSRLNLKGEILVNGSSFSIKNTDTLADIRNGINALDKGVNASLLKVTDNDNRLIISSETQGEEGLIIANVGSTDILGSLGITDGTQEIRELSDGNVLSSEFNSATATIGSLVGISSNVSGNVAIRGESFRINLSQDTLSTIRDEINSLDVSGVSASIESVEDGDITSYRLAITGTENFTDDNYIFETLGILEGGKSGTEAEFETGTLRTVNNNGNGNGKRNGSNN